MEYTNVTFRNSCEFLRINAKMLLPPFHAALRISELREIKLCSRFQRPHGARNWGMVDDVAKDDIDHARVDRHREDPQATRLYRHRSTGLGNTSGSHMVHACLVIRS